MRSFKLRWLIDKCLSEIWLKFFDSISKENVFLLMLSCHSVKLTDKMKIWKSKSTYHIRTTHLDFLNQRYWSRLFLSKLQQNPDKQWDFEANKPGEVRPLVMKDQHCNHYFTSAHQGTFSLWLWGHLQLSGSSAAVLQQRFRFTTTSGYIMEV